MTLRTEKLWACTTSGGMYYPASPSDDQVRIEDIAAALSRICRFNGNLRADVETYSVAQHSLIVSHLCRPEHALRGLLHDAHEAFLGDPIRPAHALFSQRYWSAARGWQAAIARVVGLHEKSLRLLPACVKMADVVALATERRDLCEHRDRDWGLLVEPMAERIVPMRPFDAREAFMVRFSELTAGRA